MLPKAARRLALICIVIAISGCAQAIKTCVCVAEHTDAATRLLMKSGAVMTREAKAAAEMLSRRLTSGLSHSEEALKVGHKGPTAADNLESSPETETSSAAYANKTRSLSIAGTSESIPMPPLTVMRKLRERALAMRVVENAQPHIVDALADGGGNLTARQISEIVTESIIVSSRNLSKTEIYPDAQLEFEILSGKLKIKTSTTVGTVKFSGGEINVYKIAGALSAGLIACRGMKAASLEECVSKAITELTADNPPRPLRTPGAVGIPYADAIVSEAATPAVD